MAYEKTVWRSGDLISTVRLNKIENGIEAAEAAGNTAAAQRVSFAETQELTPAQQETARTNIGADTAGNIKYDQEQSLTPAQQAQAQANIGLDDISSMVTGAVKYNEEQVLTDQEKEQALANLGLDDISSMVDGMVRFDESQSLTTEEQIQARTNMGAASTAEVNGLSSDLAEVASAVSGFGNAVADVAKSGDNISVTYLDGTSRNIPIDSGGTEFDGGYVDENNMLHLTLDGQDIEGFTPFALPAGGGGGSTSGTVSITRITDASTDCVYGNVMLIEFTFEALDSAGDPVGDGTGTWYVGGIAVARNIAVTQGRNSFDISPYLTSGNNSIRLNVSVDTGGDTLQTASKTWTVNAVNMYFTWNYDDSQVNTGALADRWTPYGEINKFTHTSVDGTELPVSSTTRSGTQQTMTIPMQTHGAHSVERWLTATIGSVSLRTDSQYHEMIFAVEGETTPIVAVSLKNQTINQYDTIQIPYVVYDPTSLTADVTLTADGVQVGSMTDIDRSRHMWTYTPTTSGAHTLVVASGGVSRTIIITATAVDIDAEEISGYAFRFKSSDLASNDAAEHWNSNGVSASYSANFDWINGGLHTETDDSGALQQYFCIKAGTRMTINYPMFASDPKASGMNFKIIFKTKNCRNYDAIIGHCFADVGINMYAHQAQFSSSGTSISVPYGEDEYIELEFDVYPAPRQENDGNYRYMMAWADGVITTCRVYGADDNFVQPQASQEGIVLGSDDCDVYIYMVKAYSTLISRDNHIDNFIMDAPNAAEMMRRYNRNDILDESGEISYEKLSTNNPDLRVWLYDIPYLTNSKDDKVSGCKFQQFWPNGGAAYRLTGTGKMSVQGTSSVTYIRGTANTDINFSALSDGNGNDLMAGGVKDETYGNNWFVEDTENLGHAKVFAVQQGDTLGPECVAVARDAGGNVTQYIKAVGMKINDDSCPITYSNTKVNFASCEQVNNMCNAAWYQRFNPYPSLTHRDCMEFEIGVQFIKDSGEIPDDKHFVLWGDNKYHMYSIANMGNSKKNVHVFHDFCNANEVCIEVNDNNADQMRMVSDDLSAENWSGKVYYGMRYPDTKNPSQVIRNAWQRLVSWMAHSNPNAATGEQLETPETYGDYTFRGHSRAGTQVLRGVTVTQYSGTYTHDTFNRRMAKMLSECEDYMVMDSFVYHFVYLERHTMVDNVSKNNFWSSSDLLHWDLSKAYDMDTSDGNNNQGQLVFDYGNEFDDDIGGMKVFNGADSVWFVFVGNLYEACRAMFVDREAAGAWSAVSYHNFLLQQQQKVPERCWIQCYWYDYLRTYEQGISGEWMTFLDGGQKTHQRKHYEFFQELYDSSKYRGSASTSQDINFRAYTPNTWINYVDSVEGAPLHRQPINTSTTITTIPDGAEVTVTAISNSEWRAVTYAGSNGFVLRSKLRGLEPTSALTVVMYNKMYISLDAGTTAMPPVKAERGVPYTIDFSSLGLLNNTQIRLNTAPMVQAISGMEKLYPDTCVFSAATRLRELTIGATDEGYVNPFLKTLALGTNTMLERLYVQNLPNANSVLDLSNCPALLYVDATGSGFTGYNFADGGLLTTAILNAPVSLTLRNLALLTDAGLSIADMTALTTLRFENVEHVDALPLVNAAIALQIARLTGIDWVMSDTSVPDRLYLLQGLDESGYTIPRAVLAGNIYVPVVTQRKLDAYNTAWPDLTVDYDNMTTQYAVRFFNEDGTTIKDLSGNDYVQYIDQGQSAYDPITAGEVAVPVKASDVQYAYTFSGWQNLTGIVLEDKDVVAEYTSTVRTYNVRWFAQPGTMLKQVTVPYGSEALYNADPYVFPTLTDEESSYVYKVFTGWDKSTGFITGDVDVYAQWSRAALPAVGAVDLKDMSIAQIYAVAKNRQAGDYWSAKDYIDIRVGKDFTFTNVQSAVLVRDHYFDGTAANVITTDISLFDADAPSFTMAIDYEFQSPSENDTLVSCFEEDGNEGFRLRYFSNQDVQWGDKHLVVGSGSSRNMLVLRHRKGSDNLYVASYNPGTSLYSNMLLAGEMVRTRSTNTSAKLTFGGVPAGSSAFEYMASGWIHWCKIWYEDLGNTVVRQLAAWPHETWRMEFIDAGRYRLAGDDFERCAASFVANAALPLRSVMSSTATNVGGWDASELRAFVNGMCFNALPYEWQAIIRQVKINASAGDQSVDIVTSADRMYVPAYIEVSRPTVDPYVSEGTYIPWFINNASRLKFSGYIVGEDAQVISSQSDPTMMTEMYTIKEGDVWVNQSIVTSNGFIYLSAETVAKHDLVDRGDNIIAAGGSQGGVWFMASQWWNRSANVSNSTSFMIVGVNGNPGYSSAATGQQGIVLGFSI